MMELLDHVVTLWAGWMGPMLLQSSVLVAAVALVDLLLRRWAWPQVRAALWTLVLVKLVLPPGWALPTGIVPQLERQFGIRIESVWMQVAVSGQVTPQASSAQDAVQGRPAAPQDAAIQDEHAVASRTSPAAPRWLRAAFSVWAAGVLVLVVVLLWRFSMLRRWHDQERHGQVIPPWYHEILVRTAERLGVGRLPAIVFSDRLHTPAVCGVVQPVLYLPRQYTENLGPEEAEHVLLHELAHLKRGDLWLHAFAMCVQVIYWFNPLVALARWQAQHLREICTDLTVANLLRERTEGYRSTLLANARRLLTESTVPGLGLLGVFEEPFRLVSRLRWLERPTWEYRHAARATAAAVALAMFTFVLPMAGGAPPERETAQEPAPSAARLWPPGAPPAGLPSEALYVRNVTRQERALLGFTFAEELAGMSELWLADGMLAQREGRRSLIVDLARSTLTYVNHQGRTYTVAALPLDLDVALTPEMQAFLRARSTTGRVRETGGKKKVLGHECREFEVEQWRTSGAGPGRPSVYRVYACNQIPADLAPFRAFLTCLRQLYARDAAFSQDLLRIDGLQLRLVRDEGRFPWRTRTVDEVVEMERRPVPAGTWEAPDGYRQEPRIARLL